MPILLYNTYWMLYNCVLAVIPVLFGYYFLKTNNTFYKILSGILWLIFLPNTIYILTDLIHILEQWHKVPLSEKGLLIGQYVLLELVGFITFILGMRPFEKLMKHLKVKKHNQVMALVIFNFLIAFGMVLGRIQRLNSWDVFLSYERVLDSILQTLSTPQYLGLLLLFGLFCNFFYFLFKDSIYRIAVKMSRLFS